MSTTTSASHFGFASLAHYVTSGFAKLKSGLQFVETKVLPETQTILKDAEVATSIVAASGLVPQASEALLIERALDSAAGELLAAVHSTDAINGATTVDLKIGIESFNLFKQFIADQKDALAAVGFKL